MGLGVRPGVFLLHGICHLTLVLEHLFNQILWKVTLKLLLPIGLLLRW